MSQEVPAKKSTLLPVDRAAKAASVEGMVTVVIAVTGAMIVAIALGAKSTEELIVVMMTVVVRVVGHGFAPAMNQPMRPGRSTPGSR